MTLRHRLLLIFMFNMVPLGFVAMGAWRAFDVVAFYWVELIAVGLFAFARQAVRAVTKLSEGKRGEALSRFGSLLFMPLHYGFFIVMMAFMVGGFLPEGTTTRKLESPLVPAEVVIDNMEFYFCFIIACVWQGALFLADRLTPESEKQDVEPVLRAYGQLFIFFTACFAGTFMGMWTDSRLWGAVLLVAIKTVAALLTASVTEDKRAA